MKKFLKLIGAAVLFLFIVSTTLAAETKAKKFFGHDYNLVDRVTYLSRLIQSYNNSSEKCQPISNFITRDKHSYEISMLDNKKVRTKFAQILKNAQKADSFIKTLKSTMKENGIDKLDEICMKNKNIYLTLIKEIDHSWNLVIARWDEKNKKFELSDTLPAPDGVAFAPLALKNKHLIKIGYGDVGSYIWTIWSYDPATKVFEKIEKCRGHYIDPEEDPGFPIYFYLTCDQEYHPGK